MLNRAFPRCQLLLEIRESHAQDCALGHRSGRAPRFKIGFILLRTRGEDDMAANRDSMEDRRDAAERGAAAADGRIEGRSWLNNPDNLKRFFDGVSRAGERARAREQRDKYRS
jgi:hypothetical protein